MCCVYLWYKLKLIPNLQKRYFFSRYNNMIQEQISLNSLQPSVISLAACDVMHTDTRFKYNMTKVICHLSSFHNYRVLSHDSKCKSSCACFMYWRLKIWSQNCRLHAFIAEKDLFQWIAHYFRILITVSLEHFPLWKPRKGSWWNSWWTFHLQLSERVIFNWIPYRELKVG